MDFSEKTVKENLIFDGKILHLYKDDILLPNGHPAFREYIRHQGAVCVVPLTEQKDIILVEQYRYPMKSLTLEIPAGKLDPGETPLQGAVRELEEETGNKAGKWTSLGYIFTSPGYSDEKLYLYRAEDLEFVGEHPDEGEIIKAFEYPVSEIKEKIKNGEINDAKTICAVMRGR